jgi:hypothetical protein
LDQYGRRVALSAASNPQDSQHRAWQPVIALQCRLMALFVGCRGAAIRQRSEEERTFLVRIQTDEDDPQRHFGAVN